MKVALGAECASETVLTSQRVVPGVLQQEGFNFLDLDVHAAIASALTESD
jgi:NAD dependent epimerase/dehydratase family enzyme